MSIEWKVVPIQTWPGPRTEEKKDHPFRIADKNNPRWSRSGVDWSATVELLERELEMLDAENIVLQMDVTDYHIRKDGWIRADASPDDPGVILTFESKFGPLSYPCDTFRDWQANLRAIAVSLENLRRVDRYGVSKRGEQYEGWKALPGAGQSTVTMTAKEAAVEMASFTPWEPDALLHNPNAVQQAYRHQVKYRHPDRGGDVQAWHRLQDAKRALEAHHGN